MSTRRSRRRKRERKKLVHKLALQLPPIRKISTAELFDEIEWRLHAMRNVIIELETQKS